MTKLKKPVIILVSMLCVVSFCILLYGAKSEYVSSIPQIFGLSVDKAEKMAEQQNMSFIVEDGEYGEGITALNKVVVFETEEDISIPQLIGVSVDNVDSTIQQYDLTFMIDE